MNLLRFALKCNDLSNFAPKREHLFGEHPSSYRFNQTTAMTEDSNHSEKASYDNAANRQQGSGSICHKQWRSAEIAAAFEQVAPLLLETLTFHWSTGQGTRVRHILWSLYTCSHLINLGDACCGLDRRLAEALATAVAARLILGPEVESALREILQKSGEFSRFEREETATPEHLPVIYPPAPANAGTFRQMADSMDESDTRADRLNRL